MDTLNFDINGIMEHQRNRYPYLLIDRVTEVIPGKSAKGYKNLTMNEWYYPAHYEGEPIMPGMLQLESLVQMLIMTVLTMPEYKGQVTNFLSVNNARFLKKIVPGDRLDIEAELLSFKRGIVKGTSAGYVDGELACKADFSVCLPHELEKYLPRNK